MFISTEGITSTNINNSKYLCITDADNVDADGVGCDDVNSPAVLNALWILKPKINDDVPIRKETIARIFPVRPGIIASGAPWLVCCCCCCAVAVSIDTIKNNENMMKRLSNNLILVPMTAKTNNLCR